MATEVYQGIERWYAPMPAAEAPSMAPESLQVLSGSALFAGMSKRECMEIVTNARTHTFLRDELLYAQGQPVRSLILLQSGSVKHTQLSPNGDEVLLRMSGKGEAVNLQVSSTSCQHTSSARAVEACKALVWEYNRVQTLLERYPQLRKNVTQILATRLQDLEERFREVATEKVPRRLALVLLRLAKQVGKPCSHGVQIHLSREELAQMTGTTLFTISRVFSRWAEQGLVVPRREAVVVTDPERLEAVSSEEV